MVAADQTTARATRTPMHELQDHRGRLYRRHPLRRRDRRHVCRPRWLPWRVVGSAWDPVKKKKIWAIKEKFPVYSGTVVTAGDVAFYGTMDRWLKAVNAKTGEVLWKFRAGTGVHRAAHHLQRQRRPPIRRHSRRRWRLVRRDRSRGDRSGECGMAPWALPAPCRICPLIPRAVASCSSSPCRRKRPCRRTPSIKIQRTLSNKESDHG